MTKTEKIDLTTAKISPFQRKVYTALQRIPRGKVTTYADLSRLLKIRSPRAIGQALKNNPFAPAIPCHRVVRSDRTIGGYLGKTGGAELAKKRQQLLAEGIFFDPETQKIPENQIMRFSFP